MDRTNWCCQTVPAGGSPASSPRQVLCDLYGDRNNARRDDPWFAQHTGQPQRTAGRRGWRALGKPPARAWPGLALVLVLAALPLVMWLYAALSDM